jgi:hypothetical protein
MAIFLTNLLRCSSFVCQWFMSNVFFIMIDFKLQQNKINIFKHENTKWRQITSKLFYIDLIFLFCYLKSIRISELKKMEKSTNKIRASQKMVKTSPFWFIRHSKFLEKKLFHKSCIFSQKIQQIFFWRIIIFEILIRKKCFRRHIGFICHFQFLSLETFFKFLSMSKSIRKCKSVVFYS